MSGEIIQVNEIKKELTVNSDDVTRVGSQLKIIREFVKKDLKEGIDKDFAVIPGTYKKSLLKPGAEKLMKLFGLGVKVKCLVQDMDRYENFAMFIYKAEVYHLKSGTVIAECEGIANSQEKKYQNNKAFDILNTLMKMAQKRAMVGAVILAVGASDYFTQDEDEIKQQRKSHAPKKVDSSEFEESDNSNILNYTIQVAKKFKGQKLGSLSKNEVGSYVDYWMKQNTELDGGLKTDIENMKAFVGWAV